MAELFLSYAHQDRGRAETVAEMLEATGLTVWWDRQMIAGDKINDVIEEELETAKAVIVLWSRTSVKSDWVRGEAQTAHDLGKLIPVKIEDCKLPIQYRGIHTPEVYKKTEFSKLAQILSDKFKALQPLTEGTVRGPAAKKIEFTDKSVSNFIAKLETQRAQYEKEVAESQKENWGNWRRGAVPGIFSLIRKYPLGAALSIAGVFVPLIVLLAFAFISNQFMHRTKPADSYQHGIRLNWHDSETRRLTVA
jgi:hypothetical protein